MPAELSPPAATLLDALRRSVRRQPAGAILLSGGLDSSLLATLAVEAGQRPLVITVGLTGVDHPSCSLCEATRAAGPLAIPCGTDLGHAQRLVTALDLPWDPLRLTAADALATLDDLIHLRRSFDLGLLNDIPILAGLHQAQARGSAPIWTGDDADTLFGGYRFLRDVPDWPAFLRDRIPTIDPPARSIAAQIGAAVAFPYLDPAVLAVAQNLTRSDIERAKPHPTFPSFVDQFDSALTAAPTGPWGKAILRDIARHLLPEPCRDLAWRPKTDLQFGSGMCALEPFLAAAVTPADRARLDTTSIAWFNDAHRGLFLRFDRAGLSIPPPTAGTYPCRSCGGAVPQDRRHCPTCGIWPANEPICR